ncbi:MAG: PKD domain-containing protein [Granulosicoccus sp.]
MNKILLALMLCVLLTSCRGEDVDTTEATFPVTPNPDAFARYLNAAPAVPANGVIADEIHNVEDFPEAYYNTIDPMKTRDTFEKWRIANGFLNADGSPADCLPPSCVSTHVKFRDTKDLGYGRNMFLRWNKNSGDVAVYVENFQVDVIAGLPYGPLNFEALVRNEREWNFGVNAIEFSAFPATGASARKFTKFYNFAGDGVINMLSSGSQQHFVDLDDRGPKPMPTPCIVCHGGHGRTLVVADTTGTKVLAPTITGGVPGDLQAHMQTIELDTLQFANEPGFTREDNEDGIRLINEAVLSTYAYRRDTAATLGQAGDWDPTFAIEILEGRYRNNIASVGTSYDTEFVPAQWQTSPSSSSIYNSLAGPNCIVCHALRGSGLNRSISFDTFPEFLTYSDQIDHLTFERGLMPAGLLNYADFWESGVKNPALLAAVIGHSENINPDNSVIKPGAPVAKLVAPPVATGMSGSQRFDIPLSAGGSAFAVAGSYRWSVEPASSATVTVTDADSGKAVLRASTPGNYTVTLTIDGEQGGTDSATASVTVREQQPNMPAPENIRFFGDDGADIFSWLTNNCSTCHAADGGNDGIPVHYTPCNAVNLQGDANQGFDFVYRSVLARSNLDAPHDSLIVRKPTNGATDLTRLLDSDIPNYHAGGLVLGNDDDLGRLVSWILSGAPRGILPPASLIDNEAPNCR